MVWLLNAVPLAICTAVMAIAYLSNFFQIRVVSAEGNRMPSPPDLQHIGFSNGQSAGTAAIPQPDSRLHCTPEVRTGSKASDRRSGRVRGMSAVPLRGKINRTAVAQLPLDSMLWDKAIPGFGVRKQLRTPVFILRKRGRQIVLGQWPMMSVDDARNAAIDRLRSNHIVNGGSRFKDVVDLYLPLANGARNRGAHSSGTFSKTQGHSQIAASARSAAKRSRTSCGASKHAVASREIAFAQRSQPSGPGPSLKARPT